MQLLAGLNRISIKNGSKALTVISFLLALAGCNQVNSPLSTNECIDPELISAIKNDIKSMASADARSALGDNYDFSLISDADITFDLISEPSLDDNGDTSCSATITVNYLGDEDTVSDLASRVAHFAKNGPPNSNLIMDALFSIDKLRRIHDIGINSFSINEFSGLEGTSFEYDINYQVKTTYNEAGESQGSYFATSVAPAKMLATFFGVDRYFVSLAEPKDKSKNANQGTSINEVDENSHSVLDGPIQDDLFNDDELYGDDTSIERQERLSEQYLDSTFKEMEKRGLLTDEFDEDQFNWADEKIAECNDEPECNIDKNYARADELRKRFGIPLGG